MIHGLQHELQTAQLRLGKVRDLLDSGGGSPRERHDAEVESATLESRIFRLMAAILEDGEMAREIQGILNQLHVSKHKSRHRSLVTTLLEDAQSRLLRERGDNPHEPTAA